MISTAVQVVRLAPSDKWTFGLLDHVLDGTLWPIPGVSYQVVDPEDARRREPCVVILPGEEWADRIRTLNRYLSRFSRVVVIVVADEGSLFPWREVHHPAMRLWIQTPRPGVHPPGAAFYIGFGTRYDVPALVLREGRREAIRDWFFAGQITHDRRVELVEVLRGMDDGLLVETQAFGTGLDHDEFVRETRLSRWVPCPSGPVCPDSFRLYETLEAGRVPFVDARCPGYPAGVTGSDYWDLLYGPDAGLLGRIEDWSTLRTVDLDPMWGPVLSAWWQHVKRETAWQLRSDALDVHDDLVEGLTVVVTSSPVPSHPETFHLDHVLDSIRERLPGVEVIVGADGWREESACTRDEYVEYLDRLAWRCNLTEPGPTLPLPAVGWVHQANLARMCLELVHTDAVLFMEHDTPLMGEIPVDGIVAAIRSGVANVVRLSSEASVLEPWRHLYLDDVDEPIRVEGVPMLRTIQWSSRPHFAGTAWYREILSRYFADDSRTYTEDVLHRVVQAAYKARGEAAWDAWRLWTYAPAGDIKRSTHTDGRDGVSKGRIRFAYPGGHVPRDAPRPWPGGSEA